MMPNGILGNMLINFKEIFLKKIIAKTTRETPGEIRERNSWDTSSRIPGEIPHATHVVIFVCYSESVNIRTKICSVSKKNHVEILRKYF